MGFTSSYVSKLEQVSNCFLSSSCSCRWPSDISASPSFTGPSSSSLDWREEPAVEWAEPPGMAGPSSLAALAAFDRDWIKARLR